MDSIEAAAEADVPVGEAGALDASLGVSVAEDINLAWVPAAEPEGGTLLVSGADTIERELDPGGPPVVDAWREMMERRLRILEKAAGLSGEA